MKELESVGGEVESPFIFEVKLEAFCVFGKKNCTPRVQRLFSEC